MASGDSCENCLVCRPLQGSYNSIVTELRFEWDEKKARANRRKHRVSFEEAQTAFADERAVLIDDPDHSVQEERFVLLGLSSSLRVLVVCHCVRTKGDVIRIISARKAGRNERKTYNER